MPLDRIRSTPLDDAPELCRMAAAQLTSRYADGSLSPVEATQAALDRAAEVHGKFNAFTHLDPQASLASARAAEARWRAVRHARSRCLLDLWPRDRRPRH